MKILADEQAEKVLIGIGMTKLAMRGQVFPFPPGGHDAYRQRLTTLVKVLAQDDPTREAEVWACYHAALHNQEPIAAIVQRIKDLARQREEGTGGA